MLHLNSLKNLLLHVAVGEANGIPGPNTGSLFLQTPGPGTYEVTPPNTHGNKMPAYSMKGRNYMPEDSTLKPGPGQHSPEKVS